MKKSILSFMLLLLAMGGVKAQKVTVVDVEALPGEVVSFSVNLSNGKADTYTSLQFDLGLPTGITPTGTPTFSASWPGATGVVAEKGAFASAEVMTGSDIEGLVSVSLKVDESLDYGSYDVTLSNIQFRYGTEGAHDDALDVTFKVNVVSMHTIILDENSTEIPASATGIIAKVFRTINADEWSTICLPFAMTATQVKVAFGNDVQLADFTGTESEFDGDDVVGIKVNFSNATSIEANHPYIIKVSTPVTEFTVDGIDIVTDEDEACIEFDNGKTGSRRVIYSGFYGTYHAGTVLDEFTLFLNDNKFWYSAGSTKMKAFRAYFDFLDVLTSVENAASRVSISFGDEATGIRNTSFNVNDNRYYNLNGQRVENSNLRKGLYIINGRKEVIK